MYFKTLLQNLSIAVFTTLLAFSISFPAASSLRQDSSDNIEKLNEENRDDVERITVYGQRNIFQLKKDIRNKRKVFYKLFNEANNIKKYHVSCRVERRKSSSFVDHICEPRFVRTNRSRLTTARGTGGDASFDVADVSRFNMLVELRDFSYYNSEDFFSHMQKVLLETPELQETYFEILDLTEAYEQKKEDRDW
jgi:hypothetical protein